MAEQQTRQSWRQLLGGINAVVIYLILCAVFGTARMVLQIEYLSGLSGSTSGGFSAYISLAAIIVFTALSAAGAYGCHRRQMYAWWLVSGMLLLTVACILVRAARVVGVETVDFPIEARVLGTIGEGLKAACVGWLLVVFWWKKKPEFVVRNGP
jgi:hypothetical protein